MSRPSKDQYFLEMARLAATRGTCVRRQVGCVLVNRLGQVLATGYNGVARGLPHCNEEAPHTIPGLDGAPINVTKLSNKPHLPHACPGSGAASGTQLDTCQAVHAEQNALLQCGDVYRVEAAYVTHSPCLVCTKLLLNTSCRRIVFRQRYPHPGAERLWVEAGRQWWRLE